MTISENNIKNINTNQNVLNGQNLQEEKLNWVSSPGRNKDWNFGLGSRNTLGQISLPGTVYWDGDQRSLMNSWKRELTDPTSGREQKPNKSIHELSEERHSHSRDGSSQIHEMPSDLMNEVIENFNLKPNFFKDYENKTSNQEMNALGKVINGLMKR
jgi:hypothetical protein